MVHYNLSLSPVAHPEMQQKPQDADFCMCDFYVTCFEHSSACTFIPVPLSGADDDEVTGGSNEW